MFAARVKCKCGWWVEIESTGIEGDKQCWKCSGEVKAVLRGGHVYGMSKPFMTWTWQDAPVDVVKIDGKVTSR